MRWRFAVDLQVADSESGHSTIIFGVRAAELMRRQEPAFREATDALVCAVREEPPPEAITAPLLGPGQAGRPGWDMSPVARHRAFMTQAMRYPEPRPHLRGFQMNGATGCPGLSAEEIDHRRSAADRARREHELRHLAAEQRRYRLPARSGPLSELAL